MAARYWVGGTGTWNGSNTTNWSAANGGAGGASVPTTADDVYFTSSSGTGTCTLGADVSVKSITGVGKWTGTLDTANFNVSVTGDFGPSVTTLNLGSSTITIGPSVYARFYFLVLTTLNAGTSTIIVKSTGSNTHYTNSFSLYNVTFDNGGNHVISGQLPCNNLTITNPSSTYMTFYPQGSVAVSGTLTIAGYSAGAGRVQVLGLPTSWSAGTRSVSNCDFQDTTFSFPSLTGTSIGNAGNNTFITFTTPVTRYAKAAGNWTSTSTWAASSGGSAGASVPICHDSVVFDSNSATGTYTVDNTAGYLFCKNINCSKSGVNVNFSTSTSRQFTGNVIFSAGAVSFPQSVEIIPYDGNATLSLGVNTLQVLYMGSKGGTVRTITLGSNLTCTSYCRLANASFNASTYDVTVSHFQALTDSVSRTISMGSGTWTLTYGSGAQWDIQASTGITLNKGTANIVLQHTGASDFKGGGFSYNKLTLTGSTGTPSLTFTGANTFTELASTKTNAHTLNFPPSTTTTIGKWSVSGAPGALVTVKSASAVAATLAYNGTGKVSADYLNVSYITGSPTLTWYVGANSVDSGNNTNIYFSAPSSGNGLFFGSNF